MFPQYEVLHLPIVVACVIAMAYFVVRRPPYWFTGVLASVVGMCFGESLVSRDHAWLFWPSAVLLTCVAAVLAVRFLPRYRLMRPRPLSDRSFR